MDNIINYLNLPEEAKILDLACGKGRHSIYLNEMGFDVTGADLSENSIAEAKKFELRIDRQGSMGEPAAGCFPDQRLGFRMTPR